VDSENAHANDLDFPAVTVGVLTALEEEYIACLEQFDPEPRKGLSKQGRATGGILTCWLCSVPTRHGGRHIVAIMRLANMGNTAAAIGANILFQHCNNLKYLIMSGIAGAVPHPSRGEDHVRLGDIVVSDKLGVVQYDFGKQRDPLAAKGDPFAGFGIRDQPRPPSPDLLHAVRDMHSQELLLKRSDLREWESRVEEFLTRVRNPNDWKRPSDRRDRLIDSLDGMGDAVTHPTYNKRRRRKPYVFRGPIGAANIVLADPAKRDALRNRFGVRAIEMEGFGVADAAWMANIGYLIIRGTCDYCNSCKNDDWHPYAALIAAAYTRTVLDYLHPTDTATTAPTSEPPTTVLPSSPRATETSDSAGTTALVNSPEAKPWDTVASTYVQGPSRSAPTTVVEMQPDPVGPANLVGRLPALSAFTADRPFGGPEERALQDLIAEIEASLKVVNWSKLDAQASELEKQLRLLPRQGETIRDGWIKLAQAEARRQMAAKQAGRPVDPSRLHALRQEAESVTD
jgi:nucleoside phosphorylase